MGERPLVTKTCLYCRYWWPIQAPALASPTGDCHALPPTGTFPRTKAEDWCALFRRNRRRIRRRDTPGEYDAMTQRGTPGTPRQSTPT